MCKSPLADDARPGLDWQQQAWGGRVSGEGSGNILVVEDGRWETEGGLLSEKKARCPYSAYSRFGFRVCGSSRVSRAEVRVWQMSSGSLSWLSGACPPVAGCKTLSLKLGSGNQLRRHIVSASLPEVLSSISGWWQSCPDLWS